MPPLGVYRTGPGRGRGSIVGVLYTWELYHQSMIVPVCFIYLGIVSCPLLYRTGPGRVEDRLLVFYIPGNCIIFVPKYEFDITSGLVLVRP